MIKQASQSNVAEMAGLLEARKNNHRTILFLGARAGGLFRSTNFYEITQQFSNRPFSSLPRIDQFVECYRTLSQKRFGETDLDSILGNSLKELGLIRADNCLAELVKEGFFHMVISTNVDDIFERAFAHIDMRESYDFYLLIPKHISDEKDLFPSGKNISCILIKTFGDQTAQGYKMIGQDLYLGAFKKFKEFLISTLKESLLMIGFDPIWDEEIDDIFPNEGQSFWYVNEREVNSSNIKRALNLRGGRYLLGARGAYDSFIPELHEYLLGRGPSSHNFDMFNHLLEMRDISFELRNEITALRDVLQNLIETQSKDQVQLRNEITALRDVLQNFIETPSRDQVQPNQSQLEQ